MVESGFGRLRRTAPRIPGFLCALWLLAMAGSVQAAVTCRAEVSRSTVARGEDVVLVVTAQGQLQPCSMQFQRYPLEQRERMIREFTRSNTCDQCYVSIRSYLDKSFPRLLWENVSGFFSLQRS